jgi:nitrogen regulatory protein PII
MKLVTAIIRPFKLDEVRDALTKIGVQGQTVTEVRGYGRQKGHTEIYRGAEYAERFLPKIKVEIACLSNQVDRVIETIISSAKTGKIPTQTRSERRFPPAPRYQWSQTHGCPNRNDGVWYCYRRLRSRYQTPVV